MLKKFSKHFSPLLFSALPNHCIYCLTPQPETICQACFVSLPTLLTRCPKCAEPNHHGEICGHCISHPPSFDQVICPFTYSGPIIGLIKQFKKNTFAIGSNHIIAALVDHLQDHQFDMIVPVPYHWRRLIQREFNPVRELAIKVSKQIHTPYFDGLIRTKFQISQTHLNRKQRLSNLQGAFAISPKNIKADFKDKNILLLDDVITTGATCHSAALTLKRAGAKSISVACLARTPA